MRSRWPNGAFVLLRSCRRLGAYGCKPISSGNTLLKSASISIGCGFVATAGYNEEEMGEVGTWLGSKLVRQHIIGVASFRRRRA
jgi:hypothetical protein